MSCILTPAVAKYNANSSEASVQRQKSDLDLLWVDATLTALFETKGLKEGGRSRGYT